MTEREADEALARAEAFGIDLSLLRESLKLTPTERGELPGLGDYTRVIEYAESRKLVGFVCRVLSLEGLILSKKAAGRPKDQAQVTELEALLALRNKQPPEEP